MFDWLSYSFIQYAFMIALIIGLAAAILSPFLVLDEQALIADGLAHVSFTGLVLGILTGGQPLFISIPFVVLMSLLVKYLSTRKNINGDAALGIVSTLSLSIGLIIISKSSGFNRSIESMLVGSLFTVTLSEIIFSAITLVLIIVFVVLYYKPLLMMTHDAKYAKFKKVPVTFLSYTLSILTAILISIGVRTIGTLLISSFVIFPSILGMQFKKGFLYTLVSGLVMSVVAVVFGISFAHFLEIPAGSTIVVVYAIILLILLLFRNVIKGGGYRG
ncbi:MAG: metal ABC transporter permease [Candidatus Phytoplasma sp.]|mgnify:FL=1|nr:metal ABC transporter permease [Phytoplasma sp.]